MRKPKILMLGWEFPPNITGGLGVACYHIVRSLRDYASITMILPQLEPEVRIAGIRLIGIGNLDLEKIYTKKEREILRSRLSKRVMEMKLSPYPVAIAGKRIFQKSTSTTKLKKSSVQIENLFADTEIYGEDVVEKVQFFSEISMMISRKIDFDIIHAHDWMTFPAALAIKKSAKKPLIIHIHSLNVDRVGPDQQGWIFNIEKEALKEADRILPVSNYTGNLIGEHYGIDKNKIISIHNGVRRVKVFHTEKKFPEKLVLFLGRITYQKGTEYFLEVASRIIHEFNNVRFVVAGGGDRFSRMVEDGAYKEIGHKLHFTGNINRKKVYELFSMTDVFVMPSVSEPFGLVALEAAQFGIPVILSKRSGAAEVLKGAIKADFWDIERMASAILRLLADERFRNKVVEQELKDLESLTWENAAEKISGVYSEFIKP
jgi:hypothetical protein